jgi:hypothetical protein
MWSRVRQGLEGDHLKRGVPFISASVSVSSALETASPDNPPSSPLREGRRVVKMVEMEEERDTQ